MTLVNYVTVSEVVRNAFRPEFLNRLDEIILFHRFREHMGAIVQIQLERLRARLEGRKIDLKSMMMPHLAS